MTDLRAPFAPEPAQARTRLVLAPTEKEALTRFNDSCDSRTAVCRGVMEYIQDLKVQAVGGRYLTIASANETWAQAEQQAQYPSIAVVPEGEGEYQATTFTSALGPQIGQPDGRWLSGRGTFSQELRIELYTNDPKSRAAMSYAIEQAFAPVDWMYGFRLVLPHYFNAIAVYEPLKISYPDTAETAIERLRTVVYHVSAQVSLLALRSYPTLKPELRVEVTTGPAFPPAGGDVVPIPE